MVGRLTLKERLMVLWVCKQKQLSLNHKYCVNSPILGLSVRRLLCRSFGLVAKEDTSKILFLSMQRLLAASKPFVLSIQRLLGPLKPLFLLIRRFLELSRTLFPLSWCLVGSSWMPSSSQCS